MNIGNVMEHEGNPRFRLLMDLIDIMNRNMGMIIVMDAGQVVPNAIFNSNMMRISSLAYKIQEAEGWL